MVHVKRDVFAGFGWVVWKGLALIGLPLAKRKVKDRMGAGTPASSSTAAP
jgi:hypothetical protein